MKVTHVQSQVVRLPDEEPLADGPANPEVKRGFVALTLGTDQGIEGSALPSSAASLPAR